MRRNIIYKYRCLIWLIILCISQSSCSLKYYGKEKRGDMTAHWLKYYTPRSYRPIKSRQIKPRYTNPYKQYNRYNYKIKPNSLRPVTNNYKIKYTVPKNYSNN